MRGRVTEGAYYMLYGLYMREDFIVRNGVHIWFQLKELIILYIWSICISLILSKLRPIMWVMWARGILALNLGSAGLESAPQAKKI